MSSSAIGDTLRLDGMKLRRIVVANPTYPDPDLEGTGVSEVPPSVVRFAPNLRTPYSTHFSFGVEQKLVKSLMVSVSYVRVRGTKVFRSVDRNAPLGPDYLRPDPTFGFVREIGSTGTLKSNPFRLSLRARIGGRFQARFSYRLAKALNDTRGLNTLPPNSLDLANEWARANFDRRHRLRFYGSMKLPGSLRLGTILRAQSGAPYNLTTGLDANRDGLASEQPDGVPRNSLEGPEDVTFDLRFSRTFKNRKEGSPSLRLSLDAFNILNRVNFRTDRRQPEFPVFRPTRLRPLGPQVAGFPPIRLLSDESYFSSAEFPPYGRAAEPEKAGPGTPGQVPRYSLGRHSIAS